MEDGPFINDFPNKTSIQFGDFQPAMELMTSESMILVHLRHQKSCHRHPVKHRNEKSLLLLLLEILGLSSNPWDEHGVKAQLIRASNRSWTQDKQKTLQPADCNLGTHFHSYPGVTDNHLKGFQLVNKGIILVRLWSPFFQEAFAKFKNGQTVDDWNILTHQSS